MHKDKHNPAQHFMQENVVNFKFRRRSSVHYSQSIATE